MKTVMTSGFPLTSRLVAKNGFVLQCWDDRYSKGIWAVCLPQSDYCEDVNSASSAGDLDMLPATDYLLDSDADWLPIAVGNDLMDALEKLEARLTQIDFSQFQADSDWMKAVFAALDHFSEVTNDAAHDYGGMYDKFRKLPKDFTVISKAVQRQRNGGGEAKW